MQGNKVKIIYASTSGNVEAVCRKVAQVLQTHGYTTQLLRAEATDIAEVINHDLFILATSTWEHGRVNPFFDDLLSEMKGLDLHGKFAGLIGLGDTRYEPVLFCEGIEVVNRAFTASGGSIVAQPLKIDGEPYSKLESEVTAWTHGFANELL